jgi:hypothetical protein
MASNPIFDDVPAWPETNPRAVIGANRPPLDELVPMEFKEELLRERPDFLVKLDQITSSADRVIVTNDEELGRAGDLTKLFRAAASHINATHTTVKAPYLLGGRLADAERNTLNAQLDEAKRKTDARMNTYMAEREAKERAERDRIAREEREAAAKAAAAQRDREAAEKAASDAAIAAAAAGDDAAKAAAWEAQQAANAAARAADEAQAAAALAPAASKAEPVRSDAGATVSGKQVWNSEVEDYAAAFKVVKTDPKVREAIEAAVARLVRAGQREIKGVRIWPTTQAIAR